MAGERPELWAANLSRNSICFVQSGPHCARYAAGRFFKHVRWHPGMRCGTAMPISLPRWPLWHRCWSVPVLEHSLPVVTSYRPSVQQAIRKIAEFNTCSARNRVTGRWRRCAWRTKCAICNTRATRGTRFSRRRWWSSCSGRCVAAASASR